MALCTPLLAVALIFCAVSAWRWNRRHGQPGWLLREQWRTQTPDMAAQRRVRPYVKGARPAPDAESARLTVATARARLRAWENPWQVALQSLLVLVMALQVAALGGVYLAWPSALVWLCVLVLVSFAVYLPFRLRSVVGHSRRALELNEGLAARRPTECPDDGPCGFGPGSRDPAP
ncbi:hypothetical protein [Nocardiopsis alkaliphila]|uniref:hypothetical protein n=1 Tax=Nocardiopsis alkaliphila TaxID=225762 RepID=UPI000346BD56|nr:hypothetical protein [Nocardiopsis alkaliphila]